GEGARGDPTVVRVVAAEQAVDLADLFDDLLAHRMLEVQDGVERPVEVVGDVRDLFEESVGRVRHDSPVTSPAMSTVNSVEQCGQVTAACEWPSWLIRRYRSWRNARSEANRFSTTNVSTSANVPSAVIVRVRRMMPRYDGFSRTR